MSEPEPDIAVIDTVATGWGLPHPSRAHLIVEVAESSRRVDLGHKPRIYADAGVPLYWVVDLAARRTVVHAGPRTAPDSGYDRITTLPFTADLEVLDVRVRLSELIGESDPAGLEVR